MKICNLKQCVFFLTNLVFFFQQMLMSEIFKKLIMTLRWWQSMKDVIVYEWYLSAVRWTGSLQTFEHSIPEKKCSNKPLHIKTDLLITNFLLQASPRGPKSFHKILLFLSRFCQVTFFDWFPHVDVYFHFWTAFTYFDILIARGQDLNLSFYYLDISHK